MKRLALLVMFAVSGAGFGIAQADETHPIGEFMEWRMATPIESVVISVADSEELWMKEYGND